jgi:hypothetical protein
VAVPVSVRDRRVGRIRAPREQDDRARVASRRIVVLGAVVRVPEDHRRTGGPAETARVRRDPGRRAAAP